MYGSKNILYRKILPFNLWVKLTKSKNQYDEIRPVNYGTVKKLTGSEESPNDICKARVKGTKKAKNVVKDCYPNGYYKVSYTEMYSSL